MIEDRGKQILNTVRSHIGRAREGKRLLENGQSLSELNTPIEGPSNDFLLERRNEFIQQMQGRKSGDLKKVLRNIRLQIEIREETPEGGTSELHWMRSGIIQIILTLRIIFIFEMLLKFENANILT